LDNYGTHKHPAVREWLRHHPRFHLHFTPTSASWMNQVETWFSLLERKAIRRGVFHSVAALRNAIQRFLDAWNDHKHPFSWVKTPEQILSKAKQKPISGTGH
ncbi:MAG: transposase, partial [Candidatus Dormibacteria bacterium]